MVPEVREASPIFSVDLVVALQAALAVLLEVLVAPVVLQTSSVDLVVVLLEATLLLLALLPAPLLLALQVLLAPQALLALLQVERPQAERAERPLLPLPVLVRVTPQLQVQLELPEQLEPQVLQGLSLVEPTLPPQPQVLQVPQLVKARARARAKAKALELLLVTRTVLPLATPPLVTLPLATLPV